MPMKSKDRMKSVIESSQLDSSVTGIPSFDITRLQYDEDSDYTLPNNLRLGHLVERCVAILINHSQRFDLLYENVQLIDGNKTIGELDFIIKDVVHDQLLHMELAYKFYLYDPSISDDPLLNWIGPNRNDSLYQKLNKLRTKQFALLHHEIAKKLLSDLKVETISQSLCFLASLYIPYQSDIQIASPMHHAIRGFYLDLMSFTNWDHRKREYYIPIKTEWGNHPSTAQHWVSYEYIIHGIKASIQEKRSIMCWQKHNNQYQTFFIVWW